MQCDYFDSAQCRSCTLMGMSYDDQLALKDAEVRSILALVVGRTAWGDPVGSAEHGFRNKAKLAVGGTVDAPTIGILDRGGTGIDLRNCGLYEPGLASALPRLAAFVASARIAPYDVSTRRGELKNLIVTHSPDGALMLRFVLRSQESIARIRKHLGDLVGELPQIAVVSANLLPEHKAVLEGEVEIALTQQQALAMRLGGVTLYLRPQSFFQTNTSVARALYSQAQEWSAHPAASSVWDLYCGVGGFALHLAGAGRRIVGVETSPEAIASARLSAQGLPGDLTFAVGDAAAYAARSAAPDLVVVNPPRRGIGALADWLEGSGVSTVLYSSCNATSLAADLARMPSLRATHARLFDMFPQTRHHEVMVRLQREG